MSVLNIRSLFLGHKDKDLINNLSFQIESSGFLAIVGRNGCGKSTLLKAINSRIPYSGNILVQGRELSSIPNNEKVGLFSFLDQKNHIHFDIKVLELVIMGLFRFKKFMDTYNSSDYRKAEAALESLGISHLAGKNINELSGGEQQMVWLAQTILHDAKVWLLDEPTQQLDLYNKKKIFSFLHKQVQEQAKIVLCITHDLQYLHQFEGHYLLNLSSKTPVQEKINNTNIDKAINQIENQSN